MRPSTTSPLVLLHSSCAVVHLASFFYSLSLSLPSLPISFSRVSYGDDTAYFARHNPLRLDFPSPPSLHGAVALITCLFHLLVYVPIYALHSPLVWRQGFLSVRWVEYAITATMLTASSLVLSGVDRAEHVVSSAVGGVALQLVGLCIEQCKPLWKPLLCVGSLVQAASSFPILWLVASSTGGGDEGGSEEATVELWIQLCFYVFYYSLFAVNNVWDAIQWGNSQEEREAGFARTEWRYASLSLSSKVALFWIQISSYERRLAPPSLAWSRVQLYGLGISAPLLALLLLVGAGGRFLSAGGTEEEEGEGSGTPSMIRAFYLRLASWRLTPDNVLCSPPLPSAPLHAESPRRRTPRGRERAMRARAEAR